MGLVYRSRRISKERQGNRFRKPVGDDDALSAVRQVDPGRAGRTAWQRDFGSPASTNGSNGALLVCQLARAQRSHVDREAVFHVALEHPLVGFVDLLDRDDFDVGSDVVLAAEVEHLLRLGDAADGRAGQAAAGRMIRPNAATGSGFSGAPTSVRLPSRVEQVEVGVDVVLGGDAVEDEVEAAGVLLPSRRRSWRRRPRPRRAASASSILSGEVVKTTVCAPNAWANFTPMCPSPPRPTMPTFLPFVTPQWRSGE